MKTIKQIAGELNIDKQRVYRYIKRHNIKEAHQEGGALYYDEAVEAQIAQYLSKEGASHEAHQNANEALRSTSDDTAKNDAETNESSEVLFLREQVRDLQSELKTEREHSRNIAEKLAELTHNSQVLQLKSEEKQALLLSEEQGGKASEKSGLFKRLFGRKD